MKRRTFLGAVLRGAAGLALGWLASMSSRPAFADSAPPPRKPNFVFVYTDDQRWDAMGFVQREQGEQARFPWLQTPNMDRLATEGVNFRNAFVVNSLCSPSRACFLTGKYNHLNGIANNRTPFPLDSVTFATLLRQSGYTTGFFGKWHMGESQGGKRPGFDMSVSYIGQGVYPDPKLEVNGEPTVVKGWVDNIITDYALKFLDENKDKPFCMMVPFKTCHTPCIPPEKYKNQYAGAPYKPPVNGNALPPYPIEGSDAISEPGFESKPRYLNYFRTLSGADENLGRLLQALDDKKLADDTVVIFSSDQGYFVGEHMLRDKRSAYEESIRMPMLLRYPRMAKAGTSIDQMVLNIDIAPTLLDLAGVPVPSEMQGRSWKPLLEGKTDGWRKSFFYEYFFECNHPATPTINALRTEDAKLIKYPDHPEWVELYDLKSDPFEMKNLAKDPAAKDLMTRIQEELDRQAKAVQYQVPSYADRLDQIPPANTAAGRKARSLKPVPNDQQ